jgi:DNA-directed RNA polymerase specialized sigma24 family protein
VSHPVRDLRRERLLLALELLAESDRLVLALELCEGLGPDEIATALEIPARLVTRRREHALTAMRRALTGGKLRRPVTPVRSLRSAM